MFFPIMHPLTLDSIALLLVAPLTESLSPDDQAIVGAFFNVLGDLLSLNSSYLSSLQSASKQNDSQSSATDTDDTDNKYDLLQKSFQKLEEELKKLKENCSEHSSIQ